ncbi:MAG: thioredoxin [Chitinophagales bacterium]|nr:MAG: thioredoxin [Chitinophagales bacterium]
MSNEHRYTNHLIHESSPYLLQHAHNPVDWYPWGPEALEKAQKENKLLIISIGYAACHWCHVMEKESFEDTSVARLMNEKFVSIKVDREERPDLDMLYMHACQLITGGGGWPLNAIALPDGTPIYAGTYFPKEQWMRVLQQVYDFYTQNPEKAREYAQRLKEGIASLEVVHLKKPQRPISREELDSAVLHLLKTQDVKKGGRAGAPKFPMPVNYQFLLTAFYQLKHEQALTVTELTLDNIAHGGIYDHIGGGFARYSVDDAWHVPHFEKMLYDNAQLVSLYSLAFQATRKPLYRKVVYETLRWVEREMTSPENGFYSSLDADSEGEEGRFYVWTAEELKRILGTDADMFMDYYGVTPQGNWEHGKNVLHRTAVQEKIARQYHLSPAELEEKIEALKKKVFEEREKRVRPALDDKMITSWNALMIKGYTDAYRVFGEKQFLEAARSGAQFLLSRVAEKNRLSRNYKNGKAYVDAFLDDYAHTIEAFISLYQATFEESYLHQAEKWMDYALAHFHDTNSGMFFYTSDAHELLVARKMELSDNVIPSSNSVMAKNLYQLGQLLYRDDYLKLPPQMFSNMKNDVIEHPSFYANWALLGCWLLEEPFEIAIVGKEADRLRSEFDQHFLPNVFLLGSTGESSLPLLQNKFVEKQTTIYVCRAKTCKMPVTTVEAALNQLN